MTLTPKTLVVLSTSSTKLCVMLSSVLKQALRLLKKSKEQEALLGYKEGLEQRGDLDELLKFNQLLRNLNGYNSKYLHG